MAQGASTQPAAAPRLAPPPRRQVVVPDDLVELVGEERIRKLHARLAQLLKSMRTDGSIEWKVRARAGGEVLDSFVHLEEPV